MFSLFNTKVASRPEDDMPDGSRRYTRFDNKQTRFPTFPADATGPTPVRDTNEPVALCREKKPVGAHRPITRAALVPPKQFDENAHLYANTDISVSVLRKALPQRFQEMKNGNLATA